MTAIVLLGVALAALVSSVALNWRQSLTIGELSEARHARQGSAPAPVPAPAPVSAPLLPPTWPSAGAVAYADTTWRAADRYRSVNGRSPGDLSRRSPSRADLPPLRVRAAGHAPWTGGMPTLPEDAAALAELRRRYLTSALEERDEDRMTASSMRDVLDEAATQVPPPGEVDEPVAEAPRTGEAPTGLHE